jgi:2-succinyl-5-enolpyruvyl-6-hydroxy-3-cyclohexene-1-carboxylate synthase
MNAKHVNGAWSQALLATLVAAGVRDVVVSPGSRSTPLALAAQDMPELRVRLVVDERSAGFLALGLARGAGGPVALVCTSGTAAANYFPAVTEAAAARVPLVVLTADRPPRLRGLGAPQTIDQTHLYGHAVRRFAELPVPTGDANAMRSMAAQAAHVVAAALGAPAGPVHLNVPFDEPLAPGPVADPVAVALAESWRGAPRVAPGRLVGDREALAELADRLAAAARPVLLAGPDAARGEAGADLLRWAAAAGMPVVADIGAGLRGLDPEGAVVVSTGDAVLRTALGDEAPDLVVRVGGAPTGKGLLMWLSRHRASTVYLQPDHDGRDHEALADLVITGDVAEMARYLETRAVAGDSRWAGRWRAAEAAVVQAIAHGPIPAEAALLRAAVSALPEEGLLCLSNSLPIRHADTYMGAGPRGLRTEVFRGANGIDGVTSMSMGTGLGSGKPTLLVTGDLAFLHDLGGLAAAKQMEVPMVVLVLNNDGGGIFSYLPIAQATPHFEALFGTPHGLTFADAARLFQLDYTLADGPEAVADAVRAGLGRPGLTVVEAPCVRQETADEHQAFMARMRQALAEVTA